MKVIAWNCRGLGKRQAVRGLLSFVEVGEHRHFVLVRNKIGQVQNGKISLAAWTNKYASPGRGREGGGGGVAVFWRRGVDVSLRNMSQC
jgi:hypothetical protein